MQSIKRIPLPFLCNVHLHVHCQCTIRLHEKLCLEWLLLCDWLVSVLWQLAVIVSQGWSPATRSRVYASRVVASSPGSAQLFDVGRWVEPRDKVTGMVQGSSTPLGEGKVYCRLHDAGRGGGEGGSFGWGGNSTICMEHWCNCCNNTMYVYVYE